MRYRALAFAWMVSGCATAGVSTMETVAPPLTTVRNEIVVDQPFDTVWDRLVGQLSRGFYVINNIEKESRLINVSFSSNSPEAFVDCGTTTRTYRRGDVSRTFTYPVARSSEYLMATESRGFPVTYHVQRRTSLEGRANVYVAPVGGAATELSVNVRYIFSVATGGTYELENKFGTVTDRGNIQPGSNTATFNTNQPTQVDDPAVDVTCHSNGTLEGEILGFVDSR